jgi:phosphatidylinositol alpha-mannosyltransferase
MRIAVLHPYSWPEVRRGGERYAHDLMWWLAGQGHDVDYVTTTAGRRSVESVADGRIVRLPRRHPDWLARRGVTPLDTFGPTVMPWLTRHRYDVVHAMVPTAAIAAAALGQRTVYTAIGHPAPLRAADRAKDLRMFRRAIRAARVTTVLSESAAAATRDLTGAQPRVLPPGIRPDVFQPNLSPRQGGPTFLFAAAADDPRKRLPVLLDALTLLLDEISEARLVIGGPGELPTPIDRRVRAAITTLGAGTADDVARRYRDATATVLPSVDEAFGLVLVESLACGTPVVAVRSGGPCEIVAPGVGALATPDDPASLATAMAEVAGLAADPQTPARCVARAQQWSWDVIGPAHLSAYLAASSRRR